MILFTKEQGGGKKASANEFELHDPQLDVLIQDKQILDDLREELEILREIVGAPSQTLGRCCGVAGILTSRYLSCLLYTSPSPRDATLSRMPSSA